MSEDQQEQPEKKQEERGLKSRTDDWETFARELKAGSERKAEENKKAKVVEDLDSDAMMEVFGAVGCTETDLTYDDAVDKFINQLCEETFGEH